MSFFLMGRFMIRGGDKRRKEICWGPLKTAWRNFRAFSPIRVAVAASQIFESAYSNQ